MAVNRGPGLGSPAVEAGQAGLDARTIGGVSCRARRARGRRPVLAFGEREVAYDRKSHIGKLDRALDDAPARGWVVVDMKRDWRLVFAD